MRRTSIVAGFVLSSIIFATAPAQAQVSIDVSKITCDEYVHDKIPTSDFISFPAVGSLEARAMLSRWLIATWLSGYYHAKRNNWIIDTESFENNVNKLNNYCYDEKNFKVPIMEAVERVLGSRGLPAPSKIRLRTGFNQRPRSLSPERQSLKAAGWPSCFARLLKVASPHCSSTMSQGNSRTNRVSDRESNSQPNCEDHRH